MLSYIGFDLWMGLQFHTMHLYFTLLQENMHFGFQHSTSNTPIKCFLLVFFKENNGFINA